MLKDFLSRFSKKNIAYGICMEIVDYKEKFINTYGRIYIYEIIRLERLAKAASEVMHGNKDISLWKIVKAFGVIKTDYPVY